MDRAWAVFGLIGHAKNSVCTGLAFGYGVALCLIYHRLKHSYISLTSESQIIIYINEVWKKEEYVD